MRDLLETLDGWRAAGTRFALASVVRTWSSAPRQPGAAMAVSEHGEVAGSVSGGCVEGAVYELALEVLESGVPASAVYGVGDDDAFAVGMTCGGTVEVFVREVDLSQVSLVAEAVRHGRPVATATVTASAAGWPGAAVGSTLVVGPGDEGHGTLGGTELGRRIADRAHGLLARGETGTFQLCPGGHGEQRGDELTVFVESFAPRPRMLVFGANDFAAAVIRTGRFLGYHVTLVDARPVFATRGRFPDADDVVVAWPHVYLAETADVVDERTVLCVLTHDPKFDIPLLEAALRTRAGYIGAMGSRRTHEDRLAGLRAAGVPEPALTRLSSPIGLDLGGRTPQETAIAVAAEIIALSSGGTGRRLNGQPFGRGADQLQQDVETGDGAAGVGRACRPRGGCCGGTSVT